MTKKIHVCDDCTPMYGLCHGCNISNVLIDDRKNILCKSCVLRETNI